MASCSISRAIEVQVALQRAKRKIGELQQEVDRREAQALANRETGSECAEASFSSWVPSNELRDSLVDMYKANPRVNVELRQRLPSPARQQFTNLDRSEIILDLGNSKWPKAPQHFQDPVTSPSPVFYLRSVSPVSPLSQRKSPVSPLYHRDPQGEMEVDCSPNRGSSPQAGSCEVSKGPGSPDPTGHLFTTRDSFHQEIEFSPLQSFDRDKNVSFLLKEVDCLRDINKKLQEQLVQKERELQRRDVEEELREEQREAHNWERPAVVLEEVLLAQKDRDKAMMSRLLLANEERDEALLQARRLQQVAKLENLNLDDSDQDMNELLQHICNANSVLEVEQYGLVLVQHVQLARQRRDKITAQEMKVVMKERDGSVAKCKRLEQDVIQEQEQWTIKEELLTLQRDEALDDRRRLEAELQALRVGHRSQDFLTCPSSLPAEGPMAMAPGTLPLHIQLQQLLKEKQNMEAELKRCREAEQEARERVDRLERLVEVLRKKVGTGNLRTII